ncbi:MAG: protein kinase, partial [Ardenticatenales bacterium]|nr:protein kinase [Ardenticatenales bacterium]
MKVKIWGVRGSIPTPLTSQSIRDKIITALQGAKGVDLSDPMAIRAYADGLSPFVAGTVGGNTACVEVQADEQLIIIDAGSGIRQLGTDLMAGPCGRGQGVIHLFLSHTHWDHIQGFPFFLPAFVPGNRLYIYSVHQVAQTLRDQMKPATFPVDLDYMLSTIEFVPLVEGEKLMVGNVQVTNLCLPHPGRAYAYRFEHQGAVFVYASDAEYKHLDETHLEPYLRFYSGADALIFDAQFTLRDSISKFMDWGHSSALHGADIARRAGVKQLILFHHDPNSSDGELAGILDKTLAYQSEHGEEATSEILIAFEGMELDLSPTSSLSVHRLPDTEAAVLSLAGDFDERSVAEIRSRLIEVPSNGHRIEEGESQRRPRLVVDMAGIKRVSIAGLRALIDLRRQWEGSAILLSGLSPQVRRVIELANCLDFFAIYPTVQTALAALEAREALGLPGQSLKNRYRIEARLGESEMGVVFKATDTRLQRPVAIKVLSPSFSQSATARLLREAQRMARLNVPDIVSIYDWDEEQGLAYLVMEYVAGKTMRQVMEQAQPQEGGVHQPPLDISVAIDILHALEAAHRKEIVHGNLKPENILISEGVKLTDFGLRWFEEGRRLTKVPLLISRSDYLAPEQILGEAVDARTDLYALGVILYELFTGRRPFEGDGADILDQHLHQPPIPPRQLNPELSRSLDHLILKLLAKEPNQRYSSADQVRRVLLSLKRDPSAQGRVKKETGPLRLQVHQRQQKIIGRETQLSKLSTLWSLSRSGQGQIVLIAGEAGVGKTSLSKEVAYQAGDATVLIGQCGELEGSPPYQPFIEIGRDYLARASMMEVQEQLGESAAVLANLIP